MRNLDQQTSLRQAVHTRCALERTVLIKEDIGDDGRRRKRVESEPVGDQGKERLPLLPDPSPSSLPSFLTKEISRHGTAQLPAWIRAPHWASESSRDHLTTAD